MAGKQLYKVVLTQQHGPGRVRHSVVLDGKRMLLPRPAALTIESHDPDDQELTLWHWNAAGLKQTHFHVESLEAAFERAEFEFGIAPHEWLRLEY